MFFIYWLQVLSVNYSFLQYSVWVARRPPGYAFIEFDDRRDALDAIHALDGQFMWLCFVNLSSLLCVY
jgi:hypothetical protein